MTRRIFDWHPELNIFAEGIPGRMQVYHMKDGENVRPTIDEVGFVDGDDVAEHVFADDELPDMAGICIRAPWPVTWMEYSLPEKIDYGSPLINEVATEIYQQIPGGLQVGTYTFVYEVPEEERHSVLKNDLAMHLLAIMDPEIDARVSVPLWEAYSKAQGRDRVMSRRSTEHECHVIQIMSIFMADRKRWYSSGYHISYLDQYGRPIPDATADVVDPGDEMAQVVATAPLLMTLGFLNCKNIETAVVPQSGHQVKKLRKHGSPRLTRRTLVIHPQGKRYEGGPTGTGGKRRQHMARGHFKTYTDEAPLFGRVVGTFWWSPQMRGSKHLGAVEKDYRVDDE
jgi:hypothetical protein